MGGNRIRRSAVQERQGSIREAMPVLVGLAQWGDGVTLEHVNYLLSRYYALRDTLPNRPVTDIEITRLIGELEMKLRNSLSTLEAVWINGQRHVVVWSLYGPSIGVSLRKPAQSSENTLKRPAERCKRRVGKQR